MRKNLLQSSLYHNNSINNAMPPPRFLLSIRAPRRQDRTPSPVLPPQPPRPEGLAPTVTAQDREGLRNITRQITELARANRLQIPVPMDLDPPFDAAALGLKEIGNLASWTVSSCKPGCGVEALRDEDTGLFWQYVLIQWFGWWGEG